MNPRQRGKVNQLKSVQWILEHEEKYGIPVEDIGGLEGKVKRVILKSPRIHSMPIHFTGDLFSVKYGTDKKGNILKAGWDIITMPKNRDSPMYLIQTKGSSFSMSRNMDYVEALMNFEVPDYVEKEFHFWSGVKLKIIRL